MTQVIFLPAARRDLAGIFIYSERAFGQAQADRYVSEIVASCAKALMGVEVSRRESKLAGALSSHRSGSHRVYHRRDDEDNLIVVRILHKSMSVGKHL